MGKRWFWSFLCLCMLCTWAHAEDAQRYLEEGLAPQITENSYRSENIVIDITGTRYEYTDVYVADIWVKDVQSFQRALSHGAWKKSAQNIKTFAEETQGILLMTGDSSQSFNSGLAIVNGEVIRSSKSHEHDLCILYRNGEMETVAGKAIDTDAILEKQGEIWQTFLFGPSLLDDEGHALEDFTAFVKPDNPRSVIGYYEPGHYCFIQVDGRGTPSALEENRGNQGLSLPELSAFCASLGLKVAYNLDGGQSSILYFHDRVYSTPYRNGRRLTDVVLIRELEP